MSDPAVLVDAARCFECIPPGAFGAAMIFLGNEDFMHTFATSTPADYDLINSFGYTTNSVNFPGLLGLTFLNRGTLAGITINLQTSLLSLIFKNLATADAALIVQDNTVLNSIVFPVLATARSLTIQNNAALPAISFPALVSMTGALTLVGNTVLTSISAPLLTTINGGNIVASSLAALTSVSLPSFTTQTGATSINFSSCTSLTSLSLPLLANMGTSASGITGTGMTALTTLNLPALLTAGRLVFNNCTNLVNVTLTNYLPTNGRAQNFQACALSQASVDHVLARCVANAAYVSGTVSLDGGTNATPSAAGLADKATLIGRGCTVNTN